MPYGKYSPPLGSGMVDKAAKAVKKRKKSRRERMGSVMQEIESTRTGSKNYRGIKDY